MTRCVDKIKMYKSVIENKTIQAFFLTLKETFSNKN